MAKRPSKKKALGLGIRSLLSDIKDVPEEKELLNTVLEIPLDDIEVNPFQPRKDFDEESLQELADSIQLLGLIQPITVRSTELFRPLFLNDFDGTTGQEMSGNWRIPLNTQWLCVMKALLDWMI